MILRRSIVKLILGLSLVSQAINLIIFTSGDISRSGPPVIPVGEKALDTAAANPLPQALVLTAIVIGLASTAFAIVLVKRAYAIIGTDDVDQMRTTEG